MVRKSFSGSLLAIVLALAPNGVVGSLLENGVFSKADVSHFMSTQASESISIGRSLRNVATPSGSSQSSTIPVSRRQDGLGLQLDPVPDEEKRPFKMATYFDFDSSESLDKIDYIQQKLLPAVSSYLSRWMRVRYPSGPLNFGSRTDRFGDPIPPGPDGNGAYDADFLLKLCEVTPVQSFSVNVARTLSNLMFLLAFRVDHYGRWLGPHSLAEIYRSVPESEIDLVVGPKDLGEYGILVTPNVVREARDHIGCPQMAGALLRETFPRQDWSRRHYKGSILAPGFALQNSRFHFEQDVMTDMDLALLQDSGWYDVKYGSGGFNPYAFQAGCAFVDGTFEDALADERARQFLCSPEQRGTEVCLFDFSGQGICDPLPAYSDYTNDIDAYSGFFVVDVENSFFSNANADCQGAPGARCSNAADDGARALVCEPGFTCSPEGRVLVEGFLCGDYLDGCPPDELMCGSPGLLTCATPDLNDCNARGDCRQGRCFCHFGWGGDDCTVPVCETTCPGGEACPPSGFCGVPECGQWSVGDTGKGEPCTQN